MFSLIAQIIGIYICYNYVTGYCDPNVIARDYGNFAWFLFLFGIGAFPSRVVQILGFAIKRVWKENE